LRAVACAAALCAAVASSAAAQTVTSPALFDADLTAGAGATLTTAAGAAISRAEDLVVPSRLFPEEGPLGRTANVTYRVARMMWFDWPQEHLLMVVNHEVFGHGARLRERFNGPIGYRIDAPPPYGEGGGSTSFVFDREPTYPELLAVHAGGMEADGIAAALVAHQAFSSGRLRPRDALRYLEFELDTLGYVWSTDSAGEDPGHDVADFLDTYDDLAATLGSSPLTLPMLRREALAGLANPALAYAVISVVRYLATGAEDAPVPTLSIGGVRYLPMMRYRLTPYGREWSLVNELGGRMRPTTIDLRVGRGPQTTSWSVGVMQQSVASWGGWSVDAAAHVWSQPRMFGADEQVPLADSQPGALVRGRIERRIFPGSSTGEQATLVFDIGIKSDGFVPGDPLEGGVVLRGGLGIPLGW
jgi:hypothetical protein